MASRIPRGRRRAAVLTSGTPIPRNCALWQLPEVDHTHCDILIVDDSQSDDTHGSPAQPCRAVVTVKIDPWTRIILDWDLELIKLDSSEGPGNDC